MKAQSGEFKGEPVLDVEGAIEHIVSWLKNYEDGAGVQGFVVGVSGGIDSAVTSTLCAMTL